MRPVAILAAPQPTGPTVDGYAIREVRLLVPPDAPAGLTIRWQPTANGHAVGPEESLALASEEMGDTGAFEAALMAYFAQALRAKGRSVARVERGAEPIRAESQAPGVPFVRLG